MSLAGGITLGDLAAALGGRLEGDPEVRIYGATGLEDATPGAVVRVEHSRFLKAALGSPASALLATDELGPVSKPCIRVSQVRLAFARCLELFARAEPMQPGVHPTAIVGEEAVLGEGAAVGAYAVLGRRVRLGAGAAVHPHAVLGDEVEIGAGSVVYPHAVLYAGTVTGARVRIHAGAVIGGDGFGYVWSGEGHQKIPQNGRVRIEDDVEIGANTTIDRATTGETVIGPGTKIDNLVQVAHNVRTGAHCVMAAQVGIAGSATLGSGVVLGGKAGLKDHISVGDGVIAGAQAGLWGDVEPGQFVSGHPARPHREHVRIEAALGKLPELLRRVRELERRLGAGEEGGEG